MGRLLFFDIDGTLAAPGKGPSQAVEAAIRAARRAGHKAIVSTGRTAASVPEVVRAIGFDGGIYSAGGRVEAEGTVLMDQPMDPAMTRHIVEALEREVLHYALECSSGNYQNDVPFCRPAWAGLNHGSSELRRVLSQAWRTMEEYRGEPVYKISFQARERKQFDRLTQALGSGIQVVYFENLMADVPYIAGEASDRRVNKGLALERVCAYFGGRPADAVAFGDSMNDKEMLLAAGTGIAMGNASGQVKALADLTCESCEEDGVAKALARLGLLG